MLNLMKGSGNAIKHVHELGIGLIVAWLFTLRGAYLSTRASSVAHDAATPGLNPAPYLFASAVGVVGFVTVRVIRRTHRKTRDPLAWVVHRVAQVLAILASGCGGVGLVIAIVSIWEMSGPASVRWVNTYGPILVYTGVIVAVILAAFVFTPAREPADQPTSPGHQPPQFQEDTSARVVSFTAPLVALAVGAILAGLMRDLTQTSLGMWLFVLAYSVVMVGVIIGSIFALRVSISRGVFGFLGSWVITVSGLGLIVAFIGAPVSVGHLAHSSSVVLEVEDERDSVTVTGNGLAPTNPVEVILLPAKTPVTTLLPDGQGWVFQQVEFPDAPQGKGELIARATSAGGQELQAVVSFEVDGAEVEFLDDQSAGFSTDSGVSTPSWSWFSARALPCLVLLGWVITLGRVFIPLRARFGLASTIG